MKLQEESAQKFKYLIKAVALLSITYSCFVFDFFRQNPEISISNGFFCLTEIQKKSGGRES